MSRGTINRLKTELQVIGIQITDKVAKDALLFSGNEINEETISYAAQHGTQIDVVPLQPPSSQAGPSSSQALSASALAKLSEEEQLLHALQQSLSQVGPPSAQAGPSSSQALSASALANLGEEEQLLLALQQSNIKTVRDHAVQTSFEQWINNIMPGPFVTDRERTAESKQLQQSKLLNLFEGRDWDVIDPKGDGFCTIYAAFIDQGLATPSGKGELINFIVRGIQKFFKVRQELNKSKIITPRIMGDSYVIQIKGDDILYIDKKSAKNTNYLTMGLQPLQGLGNTPPELLHFIPYALNRNYLVLAYDRKSKDPYNLNFYPCYSDSYKDEDGKIAYPYENATTILYNNGHTFLLHNPNTKIKQDLIERLKRSTNIWSKLLTGGKKKRKTKKRKTKKRKTKKSRKGKKHKIH